MLITQILANLLYRKRLQRLPRSKLLCWSKNSADFDESEDNTKMLSYSTGLISQKEKDNVNPEDCISVGTALQKELDGKSFIDKFRVKGKVGNLTLLKRTVRVNEKDIVIDSLTIFNRLVFASERESTLEEYAIWAHSNADESI